MAKPLHCSQNHSPLGAVGANTLKMEPPYRTQYLSNHFLKPLLPFSCLPLSWKKTPYEELVSSFSIDCGLIWGWNPKSKQVQWTTPRGQFVVQKWFNVPIIPYPSLPRTQRVGVSIDWCRAASVCQKQNKGTFCFVEQWNQWNQRSILKRFFCFTFDKEMPLRKLMFFA